MSLIQEIIFSVKGDFEGDKLGKLDTQSTSFLINYRTLVMSSMAPVIKQQK